MATQNALKIATPWDCNGIAVYSWTLAQGDVGQAIVLPHLADKAVQFLGTFGTGTVRIEGANNPAASEADNAQWSTLNDPQGNALDVTTAKLEQLLENPYLIRPRMVGGDGTTSVTIYMVLRS